MVSALAQWNATPNHCSVPRASEKCQVLSGTTSQQYEMSCTCGCSGLTIWCGLYVRSDPPGYAQLTAPVPRNETSRWILLR